MSDEPLTVQTTRDGATMTAAVHGEIDLTTAGRIEEALTGLRPGERCVLDLRGLDFMDSAGVRLLMRLDVRARSEGWELVVACPPGPVARLLEVCRLGDRITIVSDPAAVP